MQDLYQPIAPLIISRYNPTNTSVAMIRLDGNVGNALQSIEEITKSLNPSFDFNYEFMDQAYAASYENEETVSTLANIFAVVSIFISCLGLLGLASYTTEQRTREIGVRKVHGASISSILSLISGDYARLMVAAFVIAIPVSYLLAQNWLNSFEFRAVLDPYMFLLAGIITFLIGISVVLSVSYHAASVNPVNSLRDE